MLGNALTDSQFNNAPFLLKRLVFENAEDS